MGRKGVRTTTKRSAAPSMWKIPRKQWVYTVFTSPGPHTKDLCYPLAVLLRDVLKAVSTYREAEGVIKGRQVLVDGVARTDPGFPVGLMDIIELPTERKAYRLVPSNATLLPVEVPAAEKDVKLCKIKSKVTVQGGKIQYGLHDGRSLIYDGQAKLSPGDTIVIKVPSQQVVGAFKLEKGMQALVIGGNRLGMIGKINEVKAGTFSRKAVISMEVEATATEVPVKLVLVVGKDKPYVHLSSGGVA